ncbi:hypothetical protein BX600DRAFT_554753 [Xylariales sp. PMI_506]|nr:hypothetical protein BX600DRAFT_554753 [Xylariales sp. PMI_506]
MDENMRQFFTTIQITGEISDDALPSQSQVDAMEAYLARGRPAHDAAEAITVRIATAPDPFTMDQALGGLWWFINKTAIAIPSKQPEIITLLTAIQKLPDLQVPHGRGEGYVEIEGEQPWVTLPGDFGNEWGDSISHYENQFTATVPIQSTREQARVEWIAAMAYSARLSATGDEALAGEWFFLRRSCASAVRVLDYPPDAYADFAREISAAANLFLHGGAAAIYARSRLRDPIEGYLGLSFNDPKQDGEDSWKGRELWKGAAGLSPERWQHWKARWEDIGGLDWLSEEHRRIAAEVVGAMLAAERDAL